MRIISIIISIFILSVVVWMLFFNDVSREEIPLTDEQLNNETSDIVEQTSDMKSLENMGSSDDLQTIEQDLMANDLTGLDIELSDIEQELNF